jgi:hypothetical protein
VVRSGERLLLRASEPITDFVADWVDAEQFRCRPEHARPVSTPITWATELPWATTPPPTTEAGYVRIRNRQETRATAYRYALAATMSPPTPSLVTEIDGDGHLRLASSVTPYVLEEFSGDWIWWGSRTSDSELGPFPPGARLEFRVWGLAIDRDTWALSAQPATTVIHVPD